VEDTFQLFSFLTTPGGVFSTIQVPAGYSFDTSQLSVDGTVKVTSSPSPTTGTNITVTTGPGR